MASNVYECLFILDANRYARDSNGVAGQITDMIQQCDGEVLASRLWTEQKLAYPINGHKKGTYWLSYFRLEGEKVGQFNRMCQLNDNVVRNMTVKVDPRLVDTLVAHASGKVTEEAPAETAQPEAAAEPAAEAAAPEGGD